jgi:hypothetical protein
MFREQRMFLETSGLLAVQPNDAVGRSREFYWTDRTQRVTGRCSVQRGRKCSLVCRQYFVIAKCLDKWTVKEEIWEKKIKKNIKIERNKERHKDRKNSSKYNQQDATLYNILYYCQCSTCFRRFLCPSSGSQNCTHSIWYMSSLLAATASVGELRRALTALKNIV